MGAAQLKRAWRVALAATVVAGGWLFLRFLQFANGDVGVGAHHVQAAGTLFVLVALLGAAMRPGERRAAALEPSRIGVGFAVGFVGASVVLYWPALWIGLLSDDFALLANVDAGHWGAVTTSLQRPLVMGIWAAARAAGAGAASLHLLNIIAHGLVAYLSSRIVASWIHDRPLAIAAGLVVLSYPLAVEPVAWISGAFDVFATALALAAVLAARRYQSSSTVYGVRFALMALAIAAVLAKETAAVVGVLIALDALILRSKSRALLIDTAIITVGSLAYGLIRLRGTAEAEAFALTKYTAQRALFQTMGSLAQPTPAEMRTAIGIIGVLAILTLAVVFVLTGTRDRLRVALGALAWALVAVVPVVGWIVIAADLEGSRYLYLALPAWAGLLVALPGGERGSVVRRVATAALITIVSLDLVATRRQIGAWSDAAALRDRVLVELGGDTRLRGCPAIALTDLPDTVRGAFVLRNGVVEVLAERGLPPLSGTASLECRFRWDPVQQKLR